MGLAWQGLRDQSPKHAAAITLSDFQLKRLWDMISFNFCKHSFLGHPKNEVLCSTHVYISVNEYSDNIVIFFLKPKLNGKLTSLSEQNICIISSLLSFPFQFLNQTQTKKSEDSRVYPGEAALMKFVFQLFHMARFSAV